MKKILCLTIAVLVTATTLMGCTQKAPAADETIATVKAAATTAKSTETDLPKLSGKITFQTGNGQKVEELEANAIAFMEANPGTQIEVEFVEKIETIKTRMAAGELPDIAQIPKEVLNADLPGFYLPLEDIGFTPDNIYYYDKNFVDGHLYGITSMVSFSGIVYNKKVFKDNGIDKIPATMEEFYAVCEKLKGNGVTPFATNFKDKWPLGMFMFGPGAAAFSGNGNYNNDLKDTDELISGANLDMLNFLRDVIEKGYAEPDLMSTNWGGFINDMSAGKIAMSFLGSWFPPQLANEEDRGMFPIPGGKGVPMSDDWYYGIAKTAKAPELAKAYFKHLFLDGAIYPIMGFVTPLKGAEYNEPYLKELTSFGVPSIEMNPMSSETTEIRNAMAVDSNDITQEYILSKNIQEVIDRYNKKWAEARKSVGK